VNLQNARCNDKDNPEPVYGSDGRTQLNELIPLSQSKCKVKLVGGQYHDLKAFRGLVFLSKFNLKLRQTNLLSRIGVARDWCGCNSITGSGAQTAIVQSVCLSALNVEVLHEIK
jgi:hypothetical protein